MINCSNGETDIHKMLKVKSLYRLQIMGFKVITEVPLKGRMFSIDLVGLKRKKNKIYKIGLDCLTNPSINTINEKIKNYSDYFDKLFFSIPLGCNFKDSEKIKNIWKFNNDSIKYNQHNEISRYGCALCGNIFWAINAIQCCPYCGNNRKDKFEVTSENLNFKMLTFSNPKRHKSPIIILKNPEVFEDSITHKKYGHKTEFI